MHKRPVSKRTLLAEVREKKGWTQAYVAEKVNVTVDAVRRWEGGRHLPYQKTIQKLCNLFEMIPEELGLLKEEDNPRQLERKKATKTEAYDDSKHLMFQKVSLVPASLSNTAVLTINNSSPSSQDIQGTREPHEEEKQAAWEIYVELVTRIPIAVLDHDEGILREALSSIYALFQTTRTILRSHSPAIAHCHTENTRPFSYLAVCMLNTTVRPLLSKWHPLLKAYEETRPDAVGITQYEQQWDRYTELRQEITRVREELTEYAHAFAQIAEVSSLIIDTSEARPQEVLVH